MAPDSIYFRSTSTHIKIIRSQALANFQQKELV
ncbi:hypothetical protein SAMN05216255_1420 [Pseudomonas segetis]|uniref:Uncharacterized protein n=1 Tax=Pseudomonas segetis TaxID=298908 RepID=A0A239C1D5_9PSED|nr:hypothetical protein SAMN05216255_1420 [Pseudomonas segetis]